MIGSDIPSLDATAILNDVAFPLNGVAPTNSNGFSSNGTADNVMLPTAQPISAGKMSYGDCSMT